MLPGNCDAIALDSFNDSLNIKNCCASPSNLPTITPESMTEPTHQNLSIMSEFADKVGKLILIIQLTAPNSKV